MSVSVSDPPIEIADDEPLVRSLCRPFAVKVQADEAYSLKAGALLNAGRDAVSVSRLKYDSWLACKRIALEIDKRHNAKSETKRYYFGMMMICAHMLSEEGATAHASGHKDNKAHAHISWGFTPMARKQVPPAVLARIQRVLNRVHKGEGGQVFVDPEPLKLMWNGPKESEVCR